MSKWVTILMLRICYKYIISNIGVNKVQYKFSVVHKTLAIISWCHSVSVNIFVSYFTSKQTTKVCVGWFYLAEDGAK